VGEQDSERRVALVAGATRGAAGFFVYATGRSSRAAGPSEIGRPESIEETGELLALLGPPREIRGHTDGTGIDDFR
jgi:hypothetical protein